MPARHTATEPGVANPAAIAAVAQAGPLAFLGAIVGGIAGWLLSAGAVPRPDFLPVPPGAPLQATLLFAALGLLGGIAQLADRTQEAEAPPTSTPEQR